MADLFWAIQLLRIENLCGDKFWGGERLPEVTDYLTSVRMLPAIRLSVKTGPACVA
ncbi:hypothetical protein ACVWZA_004395 [Sphingomonas sp. UYAg733]